MPVEAPPLWANLPPQLVYAGFVVATLWAFMRLQGKALEQRDAMFLRALKDQEDRHSAAIAKRDEQLAQITQNALETAKGCQVTLGQVAAILSDFRK